MATTSSTTPRFEGSTASMIYKGDNGNDSGVMEDSNKTKFHIPPGGLDSAANDVVLAFMRDGIVSFSFLITLFIISHFIVRRFIRRKDVYKRVYLPRILCTFCLSVSLAAMFLVPITIITNEILTTFPENYYVQWLNRDLIFSFWNKIFWGANISLFIILPFAYFYYEAEGVGRSFLARIKDALLVLSLVSVIFIAFVYIVYKLFFEFEGKGISSDYLPFSYSLISTLGTLFVLFCIPKGFNTLTSLGISFATPQSLDEIEAINLEISTLEDSIENNKLSNTERKRVESKLKDLKIYLNSNQNSTKRPILRKLLSFILTLLNFSFSGWVILKVFVTSVKRVIELFPSAASTGVDNVYDFLAYSSKLGPMESIFETAVIIYLMISAFVGFIYLPIFSKIRPTIASTSLRKLIINTAIILLMSSSFPVVVRILEISRFDLMGYYAHTNYLRNEVFKLIYRISFIWALIQSYVYLFKSQKTPIISVFGSIPYYKYGNQNQNNNNNNQDKNQINDGNQDDTNINNITNNTDTQTTTTYDQESRDYNNTTIGSQSPRLSTSSLLSTQIQTLILSNTSSPSKLTPTSSPSIVKRKKD